MAIERIEIPANGLRFSALAAGPADGRLVLLLHGFPQSSHAWVSQLDALGAAGYRAVAPDQRGYSAGARPPKVEDYRIEYLTADILGIADHLGARIFDLVGHDWGGAVAWHLAGRQPTRLRTLSVVSTPHPKALADARRQPRSDQAQRSSYIDLFRAEGNKAEDLLLEDGAMRLRGLYLASGLGNDLSAPYIELLTDRETLTGALNWYRATDFSDIKGMGPIITPTLYVWGTDDVALGRDAAEATSAHVQREYRFEVLEGVSHWVPELAPDRLNQLLLDHLGAHPAP